MKKQTLLRIFLILMPVLAVGLATTGDSVSVFDTQTKVMTYYSYFDILPVNGLQIVPAAAAIACLVSGIFAAVYMVKKQEKQLKIIRGLAIAAATLGVLPILIRGSVLVIPNVGVAIFMAVQWVLAYFAGKKPAQTDKPAVGRRLDGNR